MSLIFLSGLIGWVVNILLLVYRLSGVTAWESYGLREYGTLVLFGLPGFVVGSLIASFVSAFLGESDKRPRARSIVRAGFVGWFYGLILVTIFAFVNGYFQGYDCGLFHSSLCRVDEFFASPALWLIHLVYSFPGFIIGAVVYYRKHTP